MRLLALETATNHGSLALLEDSRVLRQRALDGTQYGSTIFGAITAELDAAGLGLGDLDAYAVADGPGSFTGVRIGLTAVKGLIEVSGRPAIAVSTLRAAAEAGEAEPGTVMAALDASREEIYFGLYPGGARSHAGVVEGMETAAAFARRMAEFRGPVFTPHASVAARWLQTTLIAPELAAAVGRLGAAFLARGEAVDALRLDARYIRRADAEMQGPHR